MNDLIVKIKELVQYTDAELYGEEVNLVIEDISYLLASSAAEVIRIMEYILE